MLSLGPLLVSASRSRFEAWATAHQPDLLTSGASFEARLAIFEANAKVVDALNAEHGPRAEFTLDESPFAHLTFEEFAAARLPKMGRSRAGSPEGNVEGASRALGPVPAEFDWRTKKAVTAVKDQGAMGSCWAFSAVGNVEGQRALSGSPLEDLSVEQLIECDKTEGVRQQDGEEYGDCGVFGGWPFLAYQHWMKSGGVRTDAQMPYCSGIPYGQPGYCIPCMVQGYNKSLCGNHNDLYCNASTTLGQGAAGLCGSSEGTVARLKGWRHVGSNESEIASELVGTGPLSVALDATLPFQFYRRGVLDPKGLLGGCGKDPELNHAVLLVGYGVDGGKEYWTVKNSWGPKWGEEGYFRFARGEGRCGINSEVTTAVLA